MRREKELALKVQKANKKLQEQIMHAKKSEQIEEEGYDVSMEESAVTKQDIYEMIQEMFIMQQPEVYSVVKRT